MDTSKTPGIQFIYVNVEYTMISHMENMKTIVK